MDLNPEEVGANERQEMTLFCYFFKDFKLIASVWIKNDALMAGQGP